MKNNKAESKERVYDTVMSPLVKQLIAAAKEHKIPLLIAAELDPREGDATDPMLCTTVIVGPEIPAHSERMRAAAEALSPKRTVSLGIVMVSRG